jgi:hypothetical protein
VDSVSRECAIGEILREVRAGHQLSLNLWADSLLDDHQQHLADAVRQLRDLCDELAAVRQELYATVSEFRPGFELRLSSTGLWHFEGYFHDDTPRLLRDGTAACIASLHRDWDAIHPVADYLFTRLKITHVGFDLINTDPACYSFQEMVRFPLDNVHLGSVEELYAFRVRKSLEQALSEDGLYPRDQSLEPVVPESAEGYRIENLTGNAWSR